MKNALALGEQRLLNPGDIVASIPGVRVYVLGPPPDPKALHCMLGKVGKDMYGLALSTSETATAEALAAAAASQADPSIQDRYVPFENDRDYLGITALVSFESPRHFAFVAVVRSDEIRAYQQKHNGGRVEMGINGWPKLFAHDNAAIMPGLD